MASATVSGPERVNEFERPHLPAETPLQRVVDVLRRVGDHAVFVGGETQHFVERAPGELTRERILHQQRADAFGER